MESNIPKDCLNCLNCSASCLIEEGKLYCRLHDMLVNDYYYCELYFIEGEV